MGRGRAPPEGSVRLALGTSGIGRHTHSPTLSYGRPGQRSAERVLTCTHNQERVNTQIVTQERRPNLPPSGAGRLCCSEGSGRAEAVLIRHEN